MADAREHYLEAEQLLSDAARRTPQASTEIDVDRIGLLLRQAEVHTRLASVDLQRQSINARAQEHDPAQDLGG